MDLHGAFEELTTNQKNKPIAEIKRVVCKYEPFVLVSSAKRLSVVSLIVPSSMGLMKFKEMVSLGWSEEKNEDRKRKKKTDNEAGGREIKKSCSGRIRSNRIKHANA